MHVTDILVHHFTWLFVAMTTAQLTLDEGGLGGPDCSVYTVVCHPESHLGNHWLDWHDHFFPPPGPSHTSKVPILQLGTLGGGVMEIRGA